ncbi:MAG: alkaline phosphatase D family protein [Betaproteobacteria bacterium]|nr:alkaline phosphatase D family protein [Betaproteobacteria bacterium]
MRPLRRSFLARAFALAAAGFLAPRSPAALAARRFKAPPFSLGIASGSPTAEGIVLWTRLAPEPLGDGGLGDESIEVRWEIAHDEKFARLARSGTARAEPGRAHALHVEVAGLEPAREYFYRFRAGGEASPIGRTRTAPSAGADIAGLRIALASCQQYEQGWFTAHRHLVADAPDLVAFVGDYIYESSWGREHVRKHHIPEPKTLAAYRQRYAQYKTDPDLQAAHAAAPWLVTWDDHEVANDYANDRGQDLDPRFLERRAAAYRAFFEHLPIRPSVLHPGGEVRLYGAHGWGSLASLLVLDDRQYRAHQACPRAGRGGSNTVGPACEDREAPGRTLLGAEQERWLDAALAESKARWNIIVQQTLFATAGRDTGKGRLHWTDGWDGYPHARARLLDSLARSKAANPVILGGDVHANYVCDVHREAGRPDTPIVASEFCGTSITSQGPDTKRTNAVRESNPHIHFADGTRRGYVLLDFKRGVATAKLRVVDSVKQPDAGVATIASFAVEAGRPGVKPA